MPLRRREDARGTIEGCENIDATGAPQVQLTRV